MSQHDYDLANASGASFRGDLNNALQASQEQNSGASAPGTTFAYQYWADTTNDVLRQRNSANNAWIIRATLDTAIVLAKTGAYTILLADYSKLIKCDPTSGGFTITLPAVASASDGFTVFVKNIGTANQVTIDGNGSEAIDGETTITIDNGEGVRLRSNGAGWFVEAREGEKLAVTAAGTDTYTATYGIAAYITGKTYHVTFTNTNTSTTPTLNLDSVGAKTIKKDNGGALVAGDIGNEGDLRYDGTDLILMNPKATAGTDKLVEVSSNDTTPADLITKITSTAATITITEVNDGGNETINLEQGSPAAGSVVRATLSTTTVSVAGTIGAANRVAFALNAYAFFPMVHATADGVYMQGHLTDGASADSPRFSLYNTGSSAQYDVDYRHIQA